MSRHNSIVPEEYKEYIEDDNEEDHITNPNEYIQIPIKRNRLFLYGCFIFIVTVVILFFLII